MTLLELMVVLAIIGIMAALAAGNFQGMIADQRFSTAVHQLEFQATKARLKARATNFPVRFTVRTLPSGLRAVRWEQVPCEDDWGTVCPESSCATNRCGEGGCTCPAVGPDIEVPNRMNLDSLHGLCWQGGTGVAVLPSGDHCAGNTAPASDSFPLTIEDSAGTPQTKYFFLVEPLSGMNRLIDCEGASRDPAICP